MNLGLWIQILLGALPFVTAFAAFHLSTRSTSTQAEAAAKAVDAQAYDRARGIYEGAITQLRAELGDARRAAQDARKEAHAAREDIARMRGDILRMREDNRRLTSEVAQLRLRLTGGT